MSDVLDMQYEAFLEAMYKSQTDLESICDPNPWDAEADDLRGKLDTPRESASVKALHLPTPVRTFIHKRANTFTPKHANS